MFRNYIKLRALDVCSVRSMERSRTDWKGEKREGSVQREDRGRGLREERITKGAEKSEKEGRREDRKMNGGRKGEI